MPTSGVTRSMVHLKLYSLLAVVLLSAAVVGCSDGGLERFPVYGVVTFNDNPVPRGWVVFLSESNKKQTATIGSDGQYELELPAGEYRVGVSAPREMKETGMDAFKAQPPKPYVPVRFSQPGHSGVVVKVEPTDENEIDFPLKLKRSRRRR